MTDIITPHSGKVASGADLDERAQRAVKEFRGLQPTLTTYARLLSGRKNVRVEVAAKDNGSTDGSSIYFRPPLALGDKTPHQRSICDKKDADGIPLCSACAVRQEIIVTIRHEIAHLAFNSFAEPSSYAVAQAIDAAIAERGDKYADRIKQRIENAPYWEKSSFMALSRLVNEFFPFLVNAMEDARINAATFRRAPGLKNMFAAQEKKIFREGFETADGIKRWDEAPLNHQVIIGVFCKMSGYDYSDWFHSDVVDALNDAELSRLCGMMDTVRSAESAWNLAFKVLARLRELGFCATENDPDPEPDPEESNEDEETSPEDSSESDQSGSGEAGGSAGSGSDADSEPEGDSEGEAPGGSSSDQQEAEEELDEDGGHGDGTSPTETEEGEVDDNSGSDAGDSGASAGESSDGDSEEEVQEGGDSQTGSGGDASVDLLDADPSTGEQSQGDEADHEAATADSSQQAGETPGEGGSEEGDSDDPIDTGADDGYGGTKTNEQPRPEMGSPEDLELILEKWENHTEKPKSVAEQNEQKAIDKALETAVIQGIYFTHPSKAVAGVREHFHGKPVIEESQDWSQAWGKSSHRYGSKTDLNIPEQVIQPALLTTRRAFSDNQRGAKLTGKRSGKVNTRSLGRKAWSGDDRLFQKKILPGKKDYFVVIGMDISGSTIGRNLALEKRAIMAQATLLDRVGIPFAIFAHTGNYASYMDYESRGMMLEVYHLKDANEPWNTKTIGRLDEIGSSAANLDGHALEFLRKKADESDATNKIILYYSDGKMPQENHDEELEILQREIKLCRNKNYTLLGIGIRTDSPRRHGLDTVEVNEDSDLVKVIRHLEKRLSAGS
jgi:cobalamin biosynthesis protein CobT